MSGSRVLVLAPHTDDESIGCGGTIRWHDQVGDWVVVQVFSATDEAMDEFKQAMDVLGVLGNVLRYPTRNLHKYRQEILQFLYDLDSPDIVYCPASWDCHQDHQVIHQEAVRAFHNATILGYETTKGSVLPTHLACYTSLGRHHIDTKMKALACYASQPDRRKLAWKLLPDLARLRGVQSGCQYAEAFEVIRWIR